MYTSYTLMYMWYCYVYKHIAYYNVAFNIHHLSICNNTVYAVLYTIVTYYSLLYNTHIHMYMYSLCRMSGLRIS